MVSVPSRGGGHELDLVQRHLEEVATHVANVLEAYPSREQILLRARFDKDIRKAQARIQDCGAYFVIRYRVNATDY
jgi:hypothetical protein